ncbi:hypothetical protein M2133_003020 [Parabacteroides sp. PF5-6]|nr:hypothetical protein [Parabacteroides sp. PF5-6]
MNLFQGQHSFVRCFYPAGLNIMLIFLCSALKMFIFAPIHLNKYL